MLHEKTSKQKNLDGMQRHYILKLIVSREKEASFSECLENKWFLSITNEKRNIEKVILQSIEMGQAINKQHITTKSHGILSQTKFKKQSKPEIKTTLL